MRMEVNQGRLFETPEERWQAVAAREASADGKFFYAVKTTGNYCRPICTSRMPNRENIRFFDSPQAAESAGFRPCKRCHPDQPSAQENHTQHIIQACEMMEQADECPSLQTLSEAVGLSPFYFQRLFRKIVGVTPKQFFTQKRSVRVQASLPLGDTVTEVLYEAGFGSSAQFYNQAEEILGMKPVEYQNGGKGARILYAIHPSYLGWVLIAATQVGICAIEFGDDPQDLEETLKTRFPLAAYTEEDPLFSSWVKETLTFLEQSAPNLDLPLDIQGTAFQRRVWMALREVPRGTQVSYSEIARRIGQPKAARAVAQACAANRLAIAIPCHRVIRENGELGGYRWGIERKRKLLERESTKE